MQSPLRGARVIKRRRIAGAVMTVIHHKVYSVIFSEARRSWELNERSADPFNTAYTDFRSDATLLDKWTSDRASAITTRDTRFIYVEKYRGIVSQVSTDNNNSKSKALSSSRCKTDRIAGYISKILNYGSSFALSPARGKLSTQDCT